MCACVRATDRVADASVNSDAALNTAINQLGAPPHAAVGKLSNLLFARLQFIIIFNPPGSAGINSSSCGLSPQLPNTAMRLNFQTQQAHILVTVCGNFQFGQTHKFSFDSANDFKRPI